MVLRRKKWLYACVALFAAALFSLFIAASLLSKRVEPYIRQQALDYLRKRFDSDVEMSRLQVHVPPALPLRLLFHGGRGALARIEGRDLSLRERGRIDVPPLFVIKHFSFAVDVGSLLDSPKTVKQVTLDDLEIQIPPKGERARLKAPESGPKGDEGKTTSGVLIESVLVHNAHLIILPKDKGKVPLRFDIHDLRLESVGTNQAMAYAATLTNPKPPGEIHSRGTFGPWDSNEPGDTPLKGDYKFQNADLGIFKGIAGILQSTGNFEGSLSSITARGEASVPDFRLKSSGNPVQLSTKFEVLVDGTNGNTEMKPVVATLGSTHFTTTGFVIKRDGDTRKTISLKVFMPNGRLRDVLSLAMKGPPMMEGIIRLNTTIGIPPLEGKVKEKLLLDGSFDVTDGKFLKSNIQDKIDALSRRAQGKPNNPEVDEVVHRMSGVFKMADESVTFKSLAFAIPGASVNIGGNLDMAADTLDFHGALMLDAKVSQTQTGWKRWVLKPVDPFFSKRGAGTFLHIKIVGDTKNPQFGLDRGGSSPDKESEKAAAKGTTVIVGK